MNSLHLFSHCEHSNTARELEASFVLTTSPQVLQTQLRQYQLPSGISCKEIEKSIRIPNLPCKLFYPKKKKRISDWVRTPQGIHQEENYEDKKLHAIFSVS